MCVPAVLRPTVAILLLLLFAPSIAQEAPPEPLVPTPAETPAPPAEQGDATAASTETAAAPESESPPAAAAGKKRIVMLPFEFVVYQKGIAGMEAVPDWTESANFALGDAAMEVLKDAARFEVVPLPQLDGAAEGLVREHVALFETVGMTGMAMVNAGPAWQGKKAQFDYSVGDGLQFLVDAVPADYALVLVGSSVRQSGGAVFSQFLQGAMGFYSEGGGTWVMTGIFDLRTGEVKWLNWESGTQTLGMGGFDVRKPEAARKVVTKMFEIFPASTIATFPPF
jgi:hypothetical protein